MDWTSLESQTYGLSSSFSPRHCRTSSACSGFRLADLVAPSLAIRLLQRELGFKDSPDVYSRLPNVRNSQRCGGMRKSEHIIQMKR